MVAEVLEAVHHLDTSYAAFYTAISTTPTSEDAHSVVNTLVQNNSLKFEISKRSVEVLK